MARVRRVNSYCGHTYECLLFFCHNLSETRLCLRRNTFRCVSQVLYVLPSEKLFPVIQLGMENRITKRLRRDNDYCGHT